MSRSAQELQYHSRRAISDRRLRVSPSANRRLFDRSSFSFFSLSLSFPSFSLRQRRRLSRRSHTRDLPRACVYLSGLLIPAVHFPPASNRIFADMFPRRGEISRAPRDSRFSRRRLRTRRSDVLLDCFQRFCCPPSLPSFLLHARYCV